VDLTGGYCDGLREALRGLSDAYPGRSVELRLGLPILRPAAVPQQILHAAIRSLAFKWLRILYRCWKNRKPYNEARYEESLRRHAPKAAENAKNATLELP